MTLAHGLGGGMHVVRGIRLSNTRPYGLIRRKSFIFSTARGESIIVFDPLSGQEPLS